MKESAFPLLIDYIHLPDRTADFNVSQGFFIYSIKGYYTKGFGKTI
jgi:hypothetical protein